MTSPIHRMQPLHPENAVGLDTSASFTYTSPKSASAKDPPQTLSDAFSDSPSRSQPTDTLESASAAPSIDIEPVTARHLSLSCHISSILTPTPVDSPKHDENTLHIDLWDASSTSSTISLCPLPTGEPAELKFVLAAFDASNNNLKSSYHKNTSRMGVNLLGPDEDTEAKNLRKRRRGGSDDDGVGVGGLMGTGMEEGEMKENGRRIRGKTTNYEENSGTTIPSGTSRLNSSRKTTPDSENSEIKALSGSTRSVRARTLTSSHFPTTTTTTATATAKGGSVVSDEHNASGASVGMRTREKAREEVVVEGEMADGTRTRSARVRARMRVNAEADYTVESEEAEEEEQEEDEEEDEEDFMDDDEDEEEDDVDERDRRSSRARRSNSSTRNRNRRESTNTKSSTNTGAGADDAGPGQSGNNNNSRSSSKRTPAKTPNIDINTIGYTAASPYSDITAPQTGLRGWRKLVTPENPHGFRPAVFARLQTMEPGAREREERRLLKEREWDAKRRRIGTSGKGGKRRR